MIFPTQRIPYFIINNPPQEGLPTLMFQTLIQANKRNLQSTSETEKYGSVCVTIDKTNFTRLIKTKDYKWWVSDYLLKATDLALHPKVITLFEEANGLIERVGMDLLVQEEQFIRQFLATRYIPFTKLVIKDQKTTN